MTRSLGGARWTRDSAAAPITMAAGGLMGALAAATCCLLPLTLAGLGITGAWVGTLSVLEPYQPVFLVVAAAFIGAGFWLVYRTPKDGAAAGAVCLSPVSARAVKGALWSAAALTVAAGLFSYGPALLAIA